MKTLKISELKTGNIYHCILSDLPMLITVIGKNHAKAMVWNDHTVDYAFIEVVSGHLIDNGQSYIEAAPAIQQSPYIFDFSAGPISKQTPIKCDVCTHQWSTTLRTGQSSIKCPNCNNNTEIELL